MGPCPSVTAAMLSPFADPGVSTGESERCVPVTAWLRPSADASSGLGSALMMSYITADCAPLGAPLMWKVIFRFGPGIALAAYQICGSSPSGAYLTQVFPLLSVTEVVGITEACGVVTTRRFPTLGNWISQLVRPVKTFSEEMFCRTIRMPRAGGGVPAAAAFSATERAL